MMHPSTTVIVVMMVGHIGPLSNDGCRNGQFGRMVILIPLANTINDCKAKDAEYQHKNDGKHDSKDRPLQNPGGFEASP